MQRPSNDPTIFLKKFMSAWYLEGHAIAGLPLWADRFASLWRAVGTLSKGVPLASRSASGKDAEAGNTKHGQPAV